MSARDPHPATPSRRAGALVALCVVVILEAALLLGVAGAYLVSIGRRGSEAPALGAAIAGFSLLVAVVLARSALALWRGRRWARGPVMTWQVLQGATAASLLSGEVRWVLVVLLVVAALGAVLLLLPGVVAATTRSGRSEDL